MIESLSAPVPGAQEMAYLSAGQTIDVPPAATMVLDYLDSCVRETITGGRVTVGSAQSQVAGGRVSRERPGCDGDALLQLTAAESDRGGAAVWRAVPGKGAALPPPAVTLQGVFPFVVADQPAHLVIRRLDREAPPIELVLRRRAGAARASGDLAPPGTALAPGGLYAIGDSAEHQLIFKVAEDADRSLSLPGRLLPL
jgi:hypothetical protein